MKNVVLFIAVFAATLLVSSAGATAPDAGLFEPFAGLLGTLVLFVLGVALTYGAQYLKVATAKVKNDALRTGIEVVAEFVFSKVRQLAQESVDKLKAAAADGRLTQEEAAAALRTAVEETWLGLPGELKELLLRHYGTPDAVKREIITPRVEHAVTSTGRLVSFSPDGAPVQPRRIPHRELLDARGRIGL